MPSINPQKILGLIKSSSSLVILELETLITLCTIWFVFIQAMLIKLLGNLPIILLKFSN